MVLCILFVVIVLSWWFSVGAGDGCLAWWLARWIACLGLVGVVGLGFWVLW